MEGYTVPTVMRLSCGSYNRGFFCHIGGIKRPPLSRLRVKFQACLQPLSSRISRQIPPLTLVLAAALHHSVNSFPTLLILDAICNNFSWLPYLFGASQACPAAALLTVCLKCTSVKNQLSSLDPSPSFCCLHKSCTQFGVEALSYMTRSLSALLYMKF